MKLAQILSQLLVEYTDRHPKRSTIMLDPRLLSDLVGKASTPAEGELFSIAKTL